MDERNKAWVWHAYRGIIDTGTESSQSSLFGSGHNESPKIISPIKVPALLLGSIIITSFWPAIAVFLSIILFFLITFNLDEDRFREVAHRIPLNAHIFDALQRISKFLHA